MVVVIFIIAMAAAVVLPRLPSSEGTKLKSSARNLASGIRFVSDRAIITKASYRLHLNLGDNSVRFVKLTSTGTEEAPDDEFMTRKLVEEGVSLEDVTTPGLGKITEGEAVIPFGPGGMSDCLTVHLKGGDKEFTIFAYPSGGKVEVQEGYKELEVAS